MTNSRPGLRLYKTDPEGGWLAGAVFTLKDENGQDVALPSYTSGSDGLITIAYLAPGVYTLTETEAPKGYTALDGPVTITVGADMSVTLSPASDLFSFTADESGAHIGTVTVRNRTTGLAARKKNAADGEPLEGVHFALYRQVTQTDGTRRKDYRPIPGFEDLVTDVNGVIPRVDAELQAGTYYLTETQAAPGFVLPEDDLCFTIERNGTVSLENHTAWLSRDDIQGSVFYTITIPNGEEPEAVEVTVGGVKILNGRDMEEGEFSFTLYQIDADGNRPEDGISLTTTNAAGAAGEEKAFRFDAIRYTLADYNNAQNRDDEGNAVFFYVVEEEIPEGGIQNNVVYSTSRYLVVVRLAYTDKTLVCTSRYYPYDGTIPPDLLPAENLQDNEPQQI